MNNEGTRRRRPRRPRHVDAHSATPVHSGSGSTPQDTLADAAQARPPPPPPSAPPQLVVPQPRSATRDTSVANPTVNEEFLSKQTFNQPYLSDATKVAVAKHFGFATMSGVQAMAIPLALQGKRLLVRSKTGSGKTLAFLIPIVETLRRTYGSYHALILSPTRELALQTMAAALPLCGELGRCVSLVGGSNRNTDVRQLSAPIDIIIATPGRLIDHLENTRGVADHMRGLRHVVLDEADRMLDMGFLPDVTRILRCAPSPSAMLGALYSATVPRALVDVAGLVLGDAFLSVDATTGNIVTIDDSHRLLPDDPLQFVRSVSQSVVEVSLSTIAPTLLAILNAEMTPHFKIIVFCVAARVTQYYAELLQAVGLPVLEMHSRKSQSQRQRTSEAFRVGTNVIMLSSDVTARGMDYPDVTAVIQVGMAADGEQYTHRIGRTARAGKSGVGIALWMTPEMGLQRQLPNVQMSTKSVTPAELTESTQRINAALQHVPSATRARAYCAWMGYYNSHLRQLRWDKPHLVSMANQLALIMGCPSPPALEAKTIGKMGLKGVPGIVVARKGGYAWGD